MSDASAAPSSSTTPSATLTLRDYMLHQRVLQQLLRSQPVWLLDTVLDLRYRARIRLSLTPHPQLYFTEDVANECFRTEVDGQLSLTCGTPKQRGAVCQASAVEDTYPVVPLTPACSIEPIAVTGESADSGLRLCVAPAAACGATASADSISFLILSASTEAGIAPASAWVAVLRRLCRLSSAPRRENDAIDLTQREGTNGQSGLVSCHMDPVSTDWSRAAALGAISDAEEAWPTGKPNSGPRSAAASSASFVRASPICSPAHLLTGALLDRDVEEDRQQLQHLTAALRARTREADALKAQLRRVTSRVPSPVSVGVDLTPLITDAAVDRRTVAVSSAEVSGKESERPPTMAHVSTGLVPAVQGFLSLRTETSSEEDEDNDGDDGDEAEESVSGGRGTSRALRNGLRDSVSGASFDLSVDSARPQAPRSGHVCNLGCLGPTCGDEEALRMYKAIHGGRGSSSSSCSGSCSSTSPISSAASVDMMPLPK
ncbi:hypothetical protein JKF63_07294 [Porcisia hertigi]|uniref:Uncharacterized protein n=1 Tax=Porcisia hertigi TaxID=2761500 RepID=A0A836YI35_9TRYP|nr:hypothetical protein JKF63_07294 [Porcisia hertigi]